MKAEDLKNIAVIGAGDMGHGIAEAAILAGYKVALNDVKQEFLDRGVQRIRESLQKMVAKGSVSEASFKNMTEELLNPVVDLQTAVLRADLVIEAAPEILDLKKELYRKLDRMTRKDTILASNTSNMSISQLAAETSKPDQVVGMHFFNPAVLMKLVEVIRGDKTSDETMQFAYDVCLKMGKVPVRVEKDTPGFIVNRVQAPRAVLLGVILDNVIAEPEEVDATMMAAGMPMGLYELMDFVGLDVMVQSGEYRAEVLHPDFAPSTTLVAKFKAGHLGKKSSRRFYDWSQGRRKLSSPHLRQKSDTHAGGNVSNSILRLGTK